MLTYPVEGTRGLPNGMSWIPDGPTVILSFSFFSDRGWNVINANKDLCSWVYTPNDLVADEVLFNQKPWQYTLLPCSAAFHELNVMPALHLLATLMDESLQRVPVEAEKVHFGQGVPLVKCRMGPKNWLYL